MSEKSKNVLQILLPGYSDLTLMMSTYLNNDEDSRSDAMDDLITDDDEIRMEERPEDDEDGDFLGSFLDMPLTEMSEDLMRTVGQNLTFYGSNTRILCRFLVMSEEGLSPIIVEGDSVDFFFGILRGEDD